MDNSTVVRTFSVSHVLLLFSGVIKEHIVNLCLCVCVMYTSMYNMLKEFVKKKTKKTLKSCMDHKNGATTNIAAL